MGAFLTSSSKRSHITSKDTGERTKTNLSTGSFQTSKGRDLPNVANKPESRVHYFPTPSSKCRIPQAKTLEKGPRQTYQQAPFKQAMGVTCPTKLASHRDGSITFSHQARRSHFTSDNTGEKTKTNYRQAPSIHAGGMSYPSQLANIRVESRSSRKTRRGCNKQTSRPIYRRRPLKPSKRHSLPVNNLTYKPRVGSTSSHTKPPKIATKQLATDKKV